MSAANGSPCRHCGAPPGEIIDHIVNLIHISLSENDSVLNGFGLTRDEYVSALPAAIERIRGRLAASNQDRRQFAETFLAFLRERGAISNYSAPARTSDTVYRIELGQSRTIALIQKGYPDGAHSSANWHRPAWADELYLWWICNSLQQHPGDHVWRGASRIKKKLASNPDDHLDGVIFSVPCGTPQRPCPRQQRAIGIEYRHATTVRICRT
ncbi:MAG: hypothetical protein IPG61_10290 [bacterium]|nr:hypothetical protein [bacterium]